MEKILIGTPKVKLENSLKRTPLIFGDAILFPNDPENCAADCKATIEFSNPTGTISGTVPCPYQNNQCALEFLNNEGYRTNIARGKCNCGHQPTAPDGLIYHQ